MRKRDYDGQLRDGLRNDAWRRKQDIKHAKRKKKIYKEVMAWDYPYSAHYLSKNKVHCGCKMCKPWKHYKGKNMESIRNIKKKEAMDAQVLDYEIENI